MKLRSAAVLCCSRAAARWPAILIILIIIEEIAQHACLSVCLHRTATQLSKKRKETLGIPNICGSCLCVWF